MIFIGINSLKEAYQLFIWKTRSAYLKTPCTYCQTYDFLSKLGQITESVETKNWKSEGCVYFGTHIFRLDKITMNKMFLDMGLKILSEGFWNQGFFAELWFFKVTILPKIWNLLKFYIIYMKIGYDCCMSYSKIRYIISRRIFHEELSLASGINEIKTKIVY